VHRTSASWSLRCIELAEMSLAKMLSVQALIWIIE